jgi:hypothetical protein
MELREDDEAWRLAHASAVDSGDTEPHETEHPVQQERYVVQTMMALPGQSLQIAYPEDLIPQQLRNAENVTIFRAEGRVTRAFAPSRPPVTSVIPADLGR